MKTTLFEVAVNDVAAGTCLVDKAQLDVRLGEFLDQFVEGIEGAADHAVLPDLGAVGRRDHDRNRVLVNIQTDVVDFARGCLFSLSVYGRHRLCRRL